MIQALQAADTRAIVIEQVFPHTPAMIWKALTTGALMARWIMQPHGFEPVVGNRFTYRTTPAGAWDGTISCEILELILERRFVYSWKGGDAGNAGYGSKLDTIVTWEIEPSGGGTRVKLIHAGFELPRNEVAFSNMGGGWKKVVPKLGDIAEETD